jgi:hypothetical protein
VEAQPDHAAVAGSDSGGAALSDGVLGHGLRTGEPVRTGLYGAVQRMAPGEDRVLTHGPRCGKDIDKWEPTAEKSRIKNTPETKIDQKISRS